MAAKTSWHRYGTKLCHCHSVYIRILYFTTIDSSRFDLVFCRTEPTTKKWKIEKNYKYQTDMLRSIGEQSEESVESVL